MKRMKISETIEKRRSVPPRLISGREIGREIVEELLQNANWAPNHKQTEPWRFDVYMGKPKEQLAADCAGKLNEAVANGSPIPADAIEKISTALANVPVVIVTIMQRDPAERIAEWEEIAAVSMAVQNMWLTATEMGLGGFWATPPYMDILSEVLELKEGQKALGFFFVGEATMEYPSPGRGDIAGKVTWK